MPAVWQLVALFLPAVFHLAHTLEYCLNYYLGEEGVYEPCDNYCCGNDTYRYCCDVCESSYYELPSYCQTRFTLLVVTGICVGVLVVGSLLYIVISLIRHKRRARLRPDTAPPGSPPECSTAVQSSQNWILEMIPPDQRPKLPDYAEVADVPSPPSFERAISEEQGIVIGLRDEVSPTDATRNVPIPEPADPPPYEDTVRPTTSDSSNH